MEDRPRQCHLSCGHCCAACLCDSQCPHAQKVLSPHYPNSHCQLLLQRIMSTSYVCAVQLGLLRHIVYLGIFLYNPFPHDPLVSPGLFLSPSQVSTSPKRLQGSCPARCLRHCYHHGCRELGQGMNPLCQHFLYYFGMFSQFSHYFENKNTKSGVGWELPLK